MSTRNHTGRPKPPLAKRIAHVHQSHGRRRDDDYYWLKEREDPEVHAYLEAENRYAEAVLAPAASLRSRLIDEMKSRIPADEQSAPYRDGAFFYYYRYEPGQEYPIYCRRRGSQAAVEQVLLDVNELAADEDYFSLRNFEVSPDHRLAVFAIDTRGRRFYTLRFIDLETGGLLDDRITDVTSNAEWANDGQTILYTRQDPDTLRDYQVWRHSLGENRDRLVYEERDETCWLQVERSLSGRFLFLSSIATTWTEVRYLAAARTVEEPQLFLPRESDHEYFVTDGGDRFFVLSNDGALNFRVLSAPLDDTQRSAWQEVVSHREHVLVDSVEVFETFIALSVVERGQDHVELLSRDTDELRRLVFPAGASTVCPVDNYRYDAREIRCAFEALDCPETIYDVDIASLETRLVKQQSVPGGFEASLYTSERRFVTARDGTEVPVSLLYRRGLDVDGTHPLLLYGYGSYGISIEPDFDTDVFSLIDRGFVFAIAHIRGGSEMGRQWYFDGRRQRKMNTFTDFIDVAEGLIAAGYTSATHLYASGGSAGGLLMGAVVNQAPALFKGIATRVPFVDVVTTMLDESIPLTTGEFDEWGDPRTAADFEYMLSYSPYDNVLAQDYPHMLVTTGLHDSQVQYWEPAKWVARLRATKTDDHRLLLKTDMAAGHSGKTGRYRSLDDTALIYAFLLMLEGGDA